MSYHNVDNKFTFVTEISYNLGKDLVMRYNYIQYKSNPLYNSFSLFCEENSDKIINLDDVTKFVQLGNIYSNKKYIFYLTNRLA